MNIEEEEFQDEFSTFGVNLESEDIITKLRELCQLYRLVSVNMKLNHRCFRLKESYFSDNSSIPNKTYLFGSLYGKMLQRYV